MPTPLSPTLAHVLEQTLRLLHPFMPFITEEIWQRLKPHVPNQNDLPDSIMVSDYPKLDPTAIDQTAETEMSLVQDIITPNPQLPRRGEGARLPANPRYHCRRRPNNLPKTQYPTKPRH